MGSTLNPSFDEHVWIVQIRRTIDEEFEEEYTVPVCIFNVPKSLMSISPESFVPQEVAIGPYHHWRPELYETERYKVAAAKNFQKQLQDNLKFSDVVEEITKYTPLIRGCYSKFLDFRSETLAWMMAVDASFLLEFLQINAINAGKVIPSASVSSAMLNLVDYAGTKSAHNTIIRDIMMLENQIPLFVLRKMLQIFYSSLESSADEVLYTILMALCDDLFPFNAVVELQKIEVSETAHLLDFLYQQVVPKIKAEESTSEITQVHEVKNEEEHFKTKSFGASRYVSPFLREIWKILSKINKGPMLLLKFAAKMPWKIMSNLLGHKKDKISVSHLSLFENKESMKSGDGSSSLGSTRRNKPPLLEEITIPSVSDLAKFGVRFQPTNGGISKIFFDAKRCILFLPSINLDVNSEVLMRNLVAYEASYVSGPLVFTRYVELMNGIIDTEEDVKLLRKKGIILNHLKSDGEVANLWNGMSKSIKLTKVPLLDKVLEDVNKYYNSKWEVKVGNTLKCYIYRSWRFLTLLSALLLLILMVIQAFCSVYTCHRILGQLGAST